MRHRRITFASLTLAALAAGILAAAPAPSAAPAAPATQPAYWNWAERPILGWNSWDCFGAAVNEEQTLANAQYMKDNLLSHGYNLITVDIQWYEPLAKGSSYRRGAVLEMDENGRLQPAPNRFPSTADSHSFKPLADQIHAMGLKFGVHLMPVPSCAGRVGAAPLVL